MSVWLSIFLGGMQGATELFPISSLGHAVIIPPLLHLGFKQSDSSYVPFLVLLHLGTAGALLVLYRDEWITITRGLISAAIKGEITTESEHLAIILAIATIPAAIAGVLLEKSIKSLFALPNFAAGFLIVNGIILFAAEWLRRQRLTVDNEGRAKSTLRIEQLSWRTGLLIGLAQALALMPGVSRSGITIAAGLVAGLDHVSAAKLSFLMATPVILAAGVASIPDLFQSGVPLGTYLVGAIVAGVVAYLSARFLLRYLRLGNLQPFGLYCLVLGVTSLVVLH